MYVAFLTRSAKFDDQASWADTNMQMTKTLSKLSHAKCNTNLVSKLSTV